MPNECVRSVSHLKPFAGGFAGRYGLTDHFAGCPRRAAIGASSKPFPHTVIKPLRKLLQNFAVISRTGQSLRDTQSQTQERSKGAASGRRGCTAGFARASPGRFSDIATRTTLVYQFPLGSDQLRRRANSKAPASDVIAPPSKLHTTSRRPTGVKFKQLCVTLRLAGSGGIMRANLEFADEGGVASFRRLPRPHQEHPSRGIQKISPVSCNDTELNRTKNRSVFSWRSGARFAPLRRSAPHLWSMPEGNAPSRHHVDHPRYAETVSDHAEARGKEGLTQRHLYLPAVA